MYFSFLKYARFVFPIIKSRKKIRHHSQLKLKKDTPAIFLQIKEHNLTTYRIQRIRQRVAARLLTSLKATAINLLYRSTSEGGVKQKIAQTTLIIGCPKNDDNFARVEIVKLCSPLSHRVISLGRLPRASANCFLLRPFSCINASSLFEIANESRVSSRFSRGISLNISCKERLTVLIYRKSYRLVSPFL